MPKCKGCDKEIVFARDAEGKMHILDPKPDCWAVTNGVAVRVRGAMVSHFATCPKAKEFSHGAHKAGGSDEADA